MKVQRPRIFMFSGQGSQYYQMGRDLYECHPVFRNTMQEGDIVVKRNIQRSVIDELYRQHESSQFDDLLITHPALVLVECALYQVLVYEGVKPDYVWGSSIGEYAAAVAAGVWCMETALTAAVEQAKYVIQHCPLGGMIAVLAPPALYGDSQELRESAVLAGVNFSNHFMISARNEKLDTAERFLREANAAYLRLPVEYAFHSCDIEEAGNSFEIFCQTLRPFCTPKVRFVSSMTGREMVNIPRNYFWEVVRNPIRFQKTFSQLGITDHGVFIDCGPSGTMATFVKYNLTPDSSAQLFPILTPYQQAEKQIDTLKSMG
ncbi:MAG: acyltransferase domain-containing protein [Candidatus Thiodiazotropha sp. (ex Dulcina madagascariensis)]|nr:acyltransferase domain-containing protein [Candidatus Thiodiazotropha sp. (ex Dulcina madagascariensis)]